MESPRYCLPRIAAGKHIFMEKTCAVDPVGIRTVIAAIKIATAKGLTVITGNQRRHCRDHLLNQTIHNINVSIWFLGSTPRWPSGMADAPNATDIDVYILSPWGEGKFCRLI